MWNTQSGLDVCFSVHTSSWSILFKVKSEGNLLKVGQDIKVNLKNIQNCSIHVERLYNANWENKTKNYIFASSLVEYTIFKKQAPAEQASDASHLI